MVKSLGFSTEITLALTCPPVSFLSHLYNNFANGKSVSDCRHRLHLLVLAIRKVQRANMAHHIRQNRRNHRFRHRLRLHEHCFSLHLHDRLLYRHLCCKQYHPGMGWCYLWSNEREEGCGYVNYCFYFQCFVHLDSGTFSTPLSLLPRSCPKPTKSKTKENHRMEC